MKGIEAESKPEREVFKLGSQLPPWYQKSTPHAQHGAYSAFGCVWCGVVAHLLSQVP